MRGVAWHDAMQNCPSNESARPLPAACYLSPIIDRQIPLANRLLPIAFHDPYLLAMALLDMFHQQCVLFPCVLPHIKMLTVCLPARRLSWHTSLQTPSAVCVRGLCERLAVKTLPRLLLGRNRASMPPTD